MDYDNINELITQYKSFYKGSPFVDVCDIDSFPKVSDVALTNNCKISLHKSVSDKGDINLVVFSVIDNLIKGASGQAVQNMNIMFGLDEKTALDF
jgi:N-acetyl-gamma-glutamyl-phosphate reductase